MLRFADFYADRQQTTENGQQTTDKPIALPLAAHARTRGKYYIGHLFVQMSRKHHNECV